ncbi:DUF1593 domain-containing protein [Terrimonas sp. NA20]|uniref:DUF1593 domain-containing protein n=1 Tax=Terrimonas ginsenosidimutans TaxID=2908004 RepID=A0ABS9KM52_9BACT|nr:nucleoside hydrolase-like domain-containing protein [Terrimonas ginsenosidimutans]MCG2613401.1 DUF1593 domain-containing protein [Terrimonas ginsenosidimutans]
MKKSIAFMKYILCTQAIKRTLRGSVLAALVFLQMSSESMAQHKPRLFISTDIGGTDPDDNQSMIHLLMYANDFSIEGLVSTSFVQGRKQHIVDMINLYEKDLPSLSRHAKGYPAPGSLRGLTKQGAVAGAPFKGYATATEGSKWLVECASKRSSSPLWVLVWGGLEDVAQALHDSPAIKKNIRVYWIGGPNKKWGPNAYHYIAANHPDLWMIEANATYRGWFMDADAPEELKAKTYFNKYINGSGAMGTDFINYYGGNLKMGDTPSFAYLQHGDPDNPGGDSWGGSFTRIARSPRKIFRDRSLITDTVATYAIIEWHFTGPSLQIAADSVCFEMEISGQKWPGYYLGQGRYAVRYSPKQAETASYSTISSIPALNGLKGQYVAVIPWPGKENLEDYKVGRNWYTDRKESSLFIGSQQGAKTVSKHRAAYLNDWAKRWEWLKD